jgi:hypothetical protein
MPVPDFSPGEVLTAAAMDSIGLWKVADGALSSTATNFEGCFSADYESYRIVISKFTGGSGFLAYRMLNGPTPFTTGVYQYALMNRNAVAGTGGDSATTATFGALVFNHQNTTDGSASAVLDITNPFGPGFTFGLSSGNAWANSITAFALSVGGSAVNSTNSFDGIQILNASGGTISGNVKIYGYRN